MNLIRSLAATESVQLGRGIFFPDSIGRRQRHVPGVLEGNPVWSGAGERTARYDRHASQRGGSRLDACIQKGKKGTR